MAKPVKQPVPPQPDFELLATPIGFTEITLQSPLYDWQRVGLTAVCRDVGRNRTAICAPNGSGKSAKIVAAAVLWWLTIHKRGKVIVTTADGKQLDGQIIPAIWSFREKFPHWRFVEREITNGQGGFAKFWTTDEPGRAEGWHGKSMISELGELNHTQDPLLIIVDEAKSVPEPIFMALDRCTFQSILYISSPGLMEGRFFEAFNKHKSRYFTLQVGLTDCPHISQDKIRDIIEQYGGTEHPFVQSCLYGKFMDNSADNHLFSLYDLQELYKNPPRWENGRRVAYCDFAGGGDENVLALREGNRISIVKAWRQTNEMVAVQEFLREFRRLGLEPHETFGDVSGAGKVMISRFDEIGWHMGRVNNGLAANRRDYYKNVGTEMWAETSMAVKRQEIILPEDQTLLSQLTQRRITFDNKGRVWMETKEEMRERGISSPDRADAICGAYWCGGIGRGLLMQGGKLVEVRDFIDVDLQDGNDDKAFMQDAGCYAGL